MASKRNQHFVPQFYLRFFQSAPKRIHLYDLSKRESRKDVGIKGQCYKRYFYGKNNEIEDALSELEGTSAKILQGIADARKIPRRGSQEYHAMLAFVCLQYLRTQKKARASRQLFHKLLGRAEIEPDSDFLDQLELIKSSLSMIPASFIQISDLKPHLLVSRSETFITSDSPVYTYNQYCEGIRHRGTTGLASRGLQIFVPISPSLLLVLYDGSTYKIRRLTDRWLHRSVIDDVTDIDQLNLTQMLSAERNVYFSNWGQLHDIERRVPNFEKMEVKDLQTVREYQQDNNPNRALLHMFEQMVDMSLDLSFMTIKNRANQIPLYKRAELYRGRLNEVGQGQGQDSDEETTTFSRFMGES